MYLQGDLQTMFDALFNLGVIDPVLDMDWNEALIGMAEDFDEYLKLVATVNSCPNDVGLLVERLKQFDEKTLGYLAMEVANEFSNYDSCKNIQ